MGYRLLFLGFFFYIFAIQARLVETPLSKVPLFAAIASWLLIVMTRKSALLAEIKFLQKQISKKAR
jgi:hypothetical protein